MPVVTDALDLDCHSIRDFLQLIAAVRETHARDPLRVLEDVLLDVVGELPSSETAI